MKTYIPPLITVFISVFLGCRPDLSSVVAACPRGSEVREIEALGSSAVVLPWASSKEELLPAELLQGIDPAMSRAEIENLPAAHLRARDPYLSEFETPLGRLRWSLDREYSGGDEAKVTRIYLYPRRLTMNQIFSASTLECLRNVAPKAHDVVVMSRTGDQIATLVIDGLTVKKIIWSQTPQ